MGDIQLMGAAGRMCPNISDFSKTLRTFFWKEKSRSAWENIRNKIKISLRIRNKIIKKFRQVLINLANGSKAWNEPSSKAEPKALELL